MPENCIVCPMAENIPPGRTRCLLTRRLLADNYNPPAYERNEHCPLVDLGKHGRLIDADELIEDLKHDVAMDQDSLDYEELTEINRSLIQNDKDIKQNAIDLLEHTSCIIEAEGAEE